MKTISQNHLEKIPFFEDIFHQFGLKRVDGAVYGLLVLSEHPLSSEKIEKGLHLSQSAVSQSLSTLKNHMAVESSDNKKNGRRHRVHWAREDSLKIIASIFRKREQQIIENFKDMCQKLVKNDPPHSQRSLRVKSLIQSCEMGESMIQFITELSQSPLIQRHPKMARKFSKKALHLFFQGMEPLSSLTSQLKKNLEEKWISKREQ